MLRLLAKGFPERNQAYWATALRRLAALHVTPERPGYGYLLEDQAVVVGVVLTIFTPGEHDDQPRCNLSSWYVEPDYRAYAPLLTSSLMRQRNLTLTNISPALHTRGLIESQGFSRYTDGQFFSLPALSKLRGGAVAHRLESSKGSELAKGLPEIQLLRDHAAYGCLCFICSGPAGDSPFVLTKRRIGNGLVPAAQLLYCRDAADLRDHVAGLGRALLRHGIGVVIIDANGPIPGLIGKYYPGKAPKYFRGPNRPRVGDLTYTELAMFGP